MTWRMQTNGMAYTKSQGFPVNHIQTGGDRAMLVSRALRQLEAFLLDEESEVVTIVLDLNLSKLYRLRPASSSSLPNEPAPSAPPRPTTRKSRSTARTSGSSSPTTTPAKDVQGSFLTFDSQE